MNKTFSTLEDNQDKDALIKYAEAFNLKKNRTKTEKQLLDTEKRYVIYARKSTEDEKRQVQSIEDQIEHCKKFAVNNDLEVVEIIREEKSAKTAGRRKEFRRMLDEITDGGFYNSILAWHPDRLSRNMKESGEILDMLDNDFLADLKFESFTFNNDTAGKMTLSILFAMAKEFSDKLSDDTKRGIEKTIRDGKYCGSDKKGYYKSNDGYYRKDSDSYEIYSQAWEEYKKGKTQREIREILKKKGEKISKNALSNFFRDPFYAGIYCYGDLIIDMNIDPKFEPQVTPRAFLALQKMNRDNPRGWRTSNDFRPFNNFVLCSDCNKPMTAGVSKGKSDRYLSVTCGNSKCRDTRKIKGIKPISNTIRGGIILDSTIDLIENALKIDEKTYNKGKEKYLEGRNSLIGENKEQIRIWRIKLSNLEKEEKKITDRLLDEKRPDVAEKLSKQCNIVINQRRDLESDINKCEIQNSDYKAEAEMDFPKYEIFLNFFKDVVPVLKTTDNAYLIDQIVKLVFLNITVGDKKVLKYTLNEPFETYESLKILNGVANLYGSEHFEYRKIISLTNIEKVLDIYKKLIADSIVGNNTELLDYKL